MEGLNTTILASITAGILGIAGTLAGIFVTEYFKRKERVSLYAEHIFEKKLEVYEKLYQLLQSIYEKAEKLFGDAKLSVKEKHDIWQSASLEIGNYLDKYSLYINDDIAVHIMTSLIAVDDFLDTKLIRRNSLKQYYKDKQASYNLIKEDSGIGRINNFFTVVNKPKLKSDIIDYLDEIKLKHKKGNKKTNKK